MDQQLKLNILSNVIGSDKVDRFIGQVDTLGNKLIKAASATYLFNAARQAAEYGLNKAQALIDFGDNLEALSEKTGIASQALSGYKAAADQANLSFDGLEKGLKKFSQQMGDPNAKNFRQTLSAIGITSKDSAGAIDQLADKFANMENGPKKAALAVNLFGKAGIDMIPFLNQGSQALSQFGVQFSAEFTKNADQFNDTLAVTKNLILEQSIAISEKYIPVLTDLGNAWNQVQMANREVANFDNDEVEIKAFASAVYMIFKQLVDDIDYLFTTIKNEFAFVKAINGEAANILTLGASNGTFGNVVSGFGKDWKAGDDSIKKSLEEYERRSTGRKADIDKFEESLLKSIEDRKNTTKADKKKPGSGDFSMPSDDIEKEVEAIRKFKAEQEGQIALEKIKMEAYQMSTAELAKQTIAQTIHNQAAKESIKFSQGSKAQLAAVTEQIIRQRKALIDRQEAEKASFGKGAATALNTYLEMVRDVSKQTEQMFGRVFGNIEDGLLEFVKTGKTEFKAFADAVIDDLLRISIRQATMGLYSSIGSYFSSAASAGFSGGQVVSGGTSPGVSMANISAKAGGLSGGGINVTVNVDASGSQVSGSNQQGIDVGKALAAAVKKALIVEMQPGGLLAR